jgi:hypothetical protein
MSNPLPVCAFRYEEVPEISTLARLALTGGVAALFAGCAGSQPHYLCGDGRYRKFYSGPSGWGSPNGIKGY